MSVTMEKVLTPGLGFINSSKNDVRAIPVGSLNCTTYIYEPISSNQSTVWNFKQPYNNSAAKK